MGSSTQRPAPQVDTSSTKNGTDVSLPKGPHPGYVSIPQQYTFEQKLRQQQRQNGCDPAREDNYRLQGVQLIDSIRETLHLPVRTFDTACTYYHKFRLSFRDAEYNYQDAATAALFVACKVEDTIKKSREILCAAYNVKNPDHRTTLDDKTFDQLSKIVIGLERLILETIGFDFRGRYPQKLLAKMVKHVIGTDDGPQFFAIAWDMSIDMYKTFAPIKQTTYAMVVAIMELTALVTDTHIEAVKAIDTEKYNTSRSCVVETILDLLDLYTQHQKSTKVGQQFDLQKFIDIKIALNSEVDGGESLSRFEKWCDSCEAAVTEAEAKVHTPGSVPSPATIASFPGSNSVKRSTRGQGETLRFVFDADQARKESETVADHFREEFEEYEVEQEEKIPESDQPGQQGQGRQASGINARRDRNHGPGPYDANWRQGPRHRNHQHDRHGGSSRGRKYY